MRVMGVLAVGMLAVLLWMPNRLGVMLCLGLALGAVLNYFVFGFTSGFRALIAEGRTAGMRAQLWMLAVASGLFLPWLMWAADGAVGQEYQGLVRPLGVQLLVGAFLFGWGIQWVGTCTSGSLNRLGQLQAFSWVSFPLILLGGVWAASDFGFWQAQARWGVVQWLTWGLWPGVLMQFGLIALLYGLLLVWERRQHSALEPLSLAHPMLSAALLLALLNAAIFAFSGQPWSVATVFPLWGLRVSDALGLELDWSFWAFVQSNASLFETPWYQHQVSVLALGVMGGSFLVTLAQSAWRVKGQALAPRMWLLGSVGALMMGYGAVTGFGCNIGAYFSGVASFSLHGWVWLMFALLGSAWGLFLRALWLRV
jgi:hypothetical protein